ncbi:P-loop NTPase [bacterium]|nr:P-loop NTPase [bacterium]
MSHNEHQRHDGYGSEQDAKMNKLKNRVSRISHKLLVLSGKGGVGKSTVAVNIALSLAKEGKKIGILDVDIHGPSIPGILGLIGKTIETSEEGLVPIRYNDQIKVMSVGFLLKHPDDAVIWRGPMKDSIIKQFLSDVVWGDLDYLIVDAPPGTGDEPLSVAQLMPESKAVIVTTPQEVAIADVRKSINFCRKLGIPVLGVIENMSGFVCPHCNETINIFSSGGGESMAREMKVSFLGSIPLDPAIVSSADKAVSFLETHPDSPAALAYQKILEPVIAINKPVVTSNVPEKTSDTPVANSIQFALPLAEGRLCMHFGHCEQFHFVNVDPESGEILSQFAETPPPHEPGLLPKWVREKGASFVIAGGMGSRAKTLFEQNGIKVITGAPVETPEILVKAYLKNTLKTGVNACDH